MVPDASKQVACGGKSQYCQPSIIPDKEQSADREQSAFEGGQLNSAGLLERAEEELRKAFGDDEKTIANSLRGL